MELHKCVIGVTGEAIAGSILVKLKYWQWQLEFFQGQGYDEARAMADKSKGAAACIIAK